jgi:hypothetical protein
MANNLTGAAALAYQGTNAASPSNITVHRNRPTANFYQGFSIGDFWVYRPVATSNNNELWVLMGVAGNVANWVLLSTSTGAVLKLQGNTGGPVGPTAGVINIVGTGDISVAGNPGTSTLTISLAGGSNIVSSLTTDDTHVVTPTAGNINIVGGHNITTAGTVGPNTVTINVSGTTNHALQVGNSTGSLTSLAAATNGQIPIGSTGANPVVATITAGTGIAVSNGPGSITISAVAPPVGTEVAFFYYLLNDKTNVTGNNTYYRIGSTQALTRVYDLTNSCTTAGIFTAPITGIYKLDYSATLYGGGGAAAVFNSQINTTSYEFNNVTERVASANNGSCYMSIQTLLTAGDTVSFSVAVTGVGADTMTLEGYNTNTSMVTWIAGYLIEGGTGSLNTLHTDDGNNVTATAGVINIAGANGIKTTGTVGPNTVTISSAAAGNSFFAYVSAETLTNPFTGGENTVPYNATLFNNGGHYNTGTYTYTAPVTGYYSFTATIALNHMGAGSTVTLYALQFNSTSALYSTSNFNPYAAGGYQTGPTNTSFEDTSTIFCHMTAGDTMYVDLFIDNTNAVGNPVVDVTGVEATSPTRYRTYFSGYQVA